MIKTYEVLLKSPVSKSFKCQKAADSLDIDTEKKSIHHLKIEADIETPFNVGLIFGASGSGKTTLAQSIWGDQVLSSLLDEQKPIIDQFPDHLTYEDCVHLLTGVGLTSVPCWIRPVYTLSNGQKNRAEIALKMSTDDQFIVIDEWTSVVDRTVAKAMSHCIQKFARRTGKQVVLLSCHYDVLEWLQPDWVIDCNRQEYADRRKLRRERKEKLEFTIRETDSKSWRNFSKYHYLSDRLPGGFIVCFGLFHGDNQIGFMCFANYRPHRNKSERKQMHSNRVVIHPDYVGLGLGIQFTNTCSAIMFDRGYEIWAKLSAAPLVKAREKQKDKWLLKTVQRQIKRTVIGGNMLRRSGFREKVKFYSYKWIGGGLKKGGAISRPQ